jgi:hypothetical protein
MARCEPDFPIHGCRYDTVDGVDRQVRLKISGFVCKIGSRWENMGFGLGNVEF